MINIDEWVGARVISNIDISYKVVSVGKETRSFSTRVGDIFIVLGLFIANDGTVVLELKKENEKHSFPFVLENQEFVLVPQEST